MLNAFFQVLLSLLLQLSSFSFLTIFFSFLYHLSAFLQCRCCFYFISCSFSLSSSSLFLIIFLLYHLSSCSSCSNVLVFGGLLVQQYFVNFSCCSLNLLQSIMASFTNVLLSLSFTLLYHLLSRSSCSNVLLVYSDLLVQQYFGNFSCCS